MIIVSQGWHYYKGELVRDRDLVFKILREFHDPRPMLKLPEFEDLLKTIKI